MNNEPTFGSPDNLPPVVPTPEQPTPVVVSAPQIQPAPVAVAQTAPQEPKKSKGLAIASLVVGILALAGGFFYLGLLLGLVAVILAAVALKKHTGGKILAIIGLITGALGFLISLILSIIAIVGFMGVLLGTTNTEKADWEDDYEQSVTEAKAQIAAKKDFAKGETLKVGYLNFKVVSVKDGYLPKAPVREDYDNTFSYVEARSKRTPEPGTRFVIVDVSVETTDDEDTKYFGFDLLAGGEDVSSRPTTVLDLDGLEVPPFYVPFVTGPAQPGSPRTGKVVFEVKEGVTDLKLVYSTTVQNPDTGDSTELRYTLAL